MILVTRAVHLKLAALLWAAVGVGLLTAGTLFLVNAVAPPAATGAGWVVALALGFGKGYFVLPKVAKKNIARIDQLPDRSPVYATFSPKSWLLVLLMILMGRAIRAAGTSPVIVGTLYVAVGLALSLGSRTYLQHPSTQSKS